MNKITKQVIVVNKSLSMPLGELSAQVAHASLGAILINSNRTNTSINIEYDKSEEKLLDVYQKAKDKVVRGYN